MTDYRKDFPLLSEIGENTVDGREWIYIDNAATSQKPAAVLDAEKQFYENNGTGTRYAGLILRHCVRG